MIYDPMPTPPPELADLVAILQRKVLGLEAFQADCYYRVNRLIWANRILAIAVVIAFAIILTSPQSP